MLITGIITRLSCVVIQKLFKVIQPICTPSTCHFQSKYKQLLYNSKAKSKKMMCYIVNLPKTFVMFAELPSCAWSWIFGIICRNQYISFALKQTDTGDQQCVLIVYYSIFRFRYVTKLQIAYHRFISTSFTSIYSIFLDSKSFYAT